MNSNSEINKNSWADKLFVIILFFSSIGIVTYWTYTKINFSDITMATFIYLIFSFVILFSSTRILIGVLSNKLDLYEILNLNRNKHE
jgi:hypothetical protein